MPPLCSPALSSDERRALLGCARHAITQAVCSQSIADFPAPADRLAEPGSAFVTVHCGSRLRGCVGRTDRTLALAEVVAQCAIGAALHDTRFRPLEPAELSRMSIEISVLSELQPLAPHALEAGRHGIVVCRGERRGLLLPQVAARARLVRRAFPRGDLPEGGSRAGRMARPGNADIWFYGRGLLGNGFS